MLRQRSKINELLDPIEYPDNEELLTGPSEGVDYVYIIVELK